MSGPTTAIFGLDPISILLAAAAIQASQAVQEGYAEAATAAAQQDEKRSENRTQQSAAAASGQAALDARIAAAEEEHARLCALTAPYGTAAALASSKPAPPADASPNARAAYLEQLLARNAHLVAVLDSFLAALPEARLDGLTAAQLDALPPADTTLSPQTTAARSGLHCKARARSASQPRVCWAM